MGAEQFPDKMWRLVVCQLGELSILSQLMGHILHGGRTVPDNVEMHYVSTATLAMYRMHMWHIMSQRLCMTCPFMFPLCLGRAHLF